MEDIIKNTAGRIRDDEKAGLQLIGHLDAMKPEENTKEENEARRKE